MTTLQAIISGGQCGADQAGLLAAIDLGLETGGYAPKGWLTEVGPKPKLLKGFGLTEWPEPGYPARTRANILASDATLIFGKRSAGSDLTRSLCIQLGKPHLWVGDIRVFLDTTRTASLGWVEGWLAECGPVVLNCAGNRESVSPGIEAATVAFLTEVIEHWRSR